MAKTPKTPKPGSVEELIAIYTNETKTFEERNAARTVLGVVWKIRVPALKVATGPTYTREDWDRAAAMIEDARVLVSDAAAIIAGHVTVGADGQRSGAIAAAQGLGRIATGSEAHAATRVVIGSYPLPRRGKRDAAERAFYTEWVCRADPKAE